MVGAIFQNQLKNQAWVKIELVKLIADNIAPSGDASMKRSKPKRIVLGEAPIPRGVA